MNAYLITILLLIQPAQGDVIVAELQQEVMSARSSAECESHAAKLAAEQRIKHAETLRRTKGRISGSCRVLGSMT